MKIIFLRKLLVFGCFFVLAINVSAQKSASTLTNSDILDMLGAGLPESTIVLTIQQSPANYDVSPQALIQLKKMGATQKILDAILITKQSSPSASPTQVVSTPQPGPLGQLPNGPGGSEVVSVPGEVILIDGPKRIQMKRVSTDTNTNTGKMLIPGAGLFFKAKANATLNGNHAQLRTTNTAASFELIIPADVNAGDVIVLVKLTTKADRREVQVARVGVASASSGFRKEDVVPISFAELQTYNTQTGRQIKYQVKVVSPIPPGEYALVISRAIFYDFGVDSGN